MKNIAKRTKITLILSLFMGWSLVGMAQVGTPPPPPNGHRQMGNQAPGTTGGSAPIGGGIAILLSLGAAWGGRKVYQAYRQEE